MPGYNTISFGGGRTVSGRAEGPDHRESSVNEIPCKICGVVHGRYWKGECKEPKTKNLTSHSSRQQKDAAT